MLAYVLPGSWRGSNPLTPTTKFASQCKHLAGIFLPDKPEKVPYRYRWCMKSDQLPIAGRA